MTLSVGNILSSALSKQVTALKSTSRLIASVQLQLATGKRINSALDNPQNFFESQALGNRARDIERLLDGIGVSIRTVQEASNGVTAIERLLEQAETIALDKREKLESGTEILNNYEVIKEVIPTQLSAQILADNPDAYWRLDETAGAVATNLGAGGAAIDALYSGGVVQGAPALYSNGGAVSADFDGVDDRIRVPDSPLINTAVTAERTIELVFNADTVAGRQILYEEGAGVNGITIYIDNGSLYFTAEDDQGAQRFADLNINTSVVAGQVYHVALVFDGPNATFAGYLDGVNVGTITGLATEGVFPSHSGDIGIGGMNGSVQWHDGESSGSNGFNFDGRIADVAIYNRALSDSELLSHASSLNATTTTEIHNRDFQKVLEQIDGIAVDAQYRGVNLLNGDNLITTFNESRSNILTTEGVDFTTEGFGIRDYDFDDLTDVSLIIEDVRRALQEVRRFGRSLASDLSIIKTRETFARSTVNTLKSGASDLVVADQNEVGASMLALQTREAIQATVLSLTAQSNFAVLRLF